eukprot:1405354-Rhodomonas_salina.1
MNQTRLDSISECQMTIYFQKEDIITLKDKVIKLEQLCAKAPSAAPPSAQSAESTTAPPLPLEVSTAARASCYALLAVLVCMAGVLLLLRALGGGDAGDRLPLIM